jgi:transcription antitermination protein NusB
MTQQRIGGVMGAEQAARRKRARQAAAQALYQWQMAGQELVAIEQQFHEEQDMSRVDSEYFRDLLMNIPKRVHEIDDMLKPHIDRPVAQLDPVEHAILRIGAYELRYRLDVPAVVIINEGIKSAKIFGGEQSHKYVNSLLDKLARLEPMRAHEFG